ncbi:MAG: GAF domain-containing protein [Elainellaceae cyanobacterium]
MNEDTWADIGCSIAWIYSISLATLDQSTITQGVESNTKLVVLLEVLISITSVTALLLGLMVMRQRRTASALKFSQEKFSKAVEFSPDAITLSHLSDGRFIEVNDSFVALTGYSRREALGQTSIELGLWYDPDERQELVENIQRTGMVRNQDIMFHHRDGQVIHTLLSTAVFRLGHQPCLLTVARDVSKRKQAQETLRLSAERDRLLGEIALRIHQLLDLSDILEATVTEVQRFLDVDRAFIHQMHRDCVSEIVAESVALPFDSILGQAAEIPTEDIRAAMGENSVIQIDDISLLEDDCPYRNFVQRYETKSAMGAAIVVNGQLFGVLVVHQCSQKRQWRRQESELLERIATQVAIAISQAKLLKEVQDLNTSLEQQVAERTEELQQQVEAVHDLNGFLRFCLYATTHDLRTTVIGNLMLLQSLDVDSQDTVSVSADLIVRMHQASKAQLRKLDDLQDIYQARTTGLTLTPSAVSLSRLVAQVRLELAAYIRENRAQLTVNIPDELPLLWVDSDRICQVLHQLIANAIGHNLPGVSVTLSARATDADVLCCVEDTGAGLCPERCDRLFELCIDDPNFSHYGSVKLGLYRCRQIVEAHGGTIDVESREGEGTRLEFSLPRPQKAL